MAADDAPPAPGRFGSRKRKSEKAPKRQSGKGRKVVGLKIGASQLAAAIVTETDRGHELLGLARRPLAAGIVVDGEVRDESALAGAVRSFFDDEKLPKGNVRIGLSSNRIGVRTLDIDGVEDASRFDNAVRFKAHEVLPVALSESVLDYRVLEERIGEDGSRSGRVLLVVAPRDQVEPYTRVADLAGIGLEALDLEALGLLRAFVAPGSGALTPDDTASVVVSIGHESSTLLVAGGGACEFTRVFDWGGSALEEAIASSLDVRPAEAATILRHLSLSGPGRQYETLDEVTRARATDAIRQRLTPFARELVNSLQFYQTQAESLGIGGIQITGGTSHLEGIDDALHQMIGVNVSVGDPLSRVVRAEDFDPALESAIGSFGVPIGLAIDDLSMRGVNLLPKGTVVKKSRRSTLVAIGAPIAVAVPVAALAFMYLGAHGKVTDQQSQLDAARGRARGVAAADPAGDRYGRRRRRGSSCHGRCQRPRWPARVGGGLPRHVEGAAGERLALDSVAHRAGGGEPGRLSGRDARGGRGSAGADSRGDRRLHPHAARCCPSPRATGDAALTQARDADLEPVPADRNQEGRALRHRCRPEPDRRCVMSSLLRSPKGKIGAIAAGGLLVLLALWFLLVSPQRAKATELTADVAAARAQVVERKTALATPAADVTVRPSDLYRLTKALPDDTNMSGIVLDVNRIAARNKLTFISITPGPQIAGTGYLQQPLDVAVQGRFAHISSFLADLRTLVSVRGKRLDARGRLYSVSSVNITAPESPDKFPVVKAAVKLNAYAFSAPVPATPAPDSSTSTDTSSDGTVAAGATP